MILSAPVTKASPPRPRPEEPRGYLHGFGPRERERLRRQARVLEPWVHDRLPFYRRRELIVVGRPMIAAARIQRMTRLFGAHVIADEETFRRLDGGVTYRELGTPRLKGLKQRQLLYEVVAAAGAADASSARNPAWTSPPS